MDIRKIKKLIDLLESSSMTEIEVQEGEESVRIVKSSATMTPSTISTPVQNVVTPEVQSVVSEVKPVIDTGGTNAITAPMVGTFYAKPAPDAKPFVSVGDSVQVGDVICIIEAMKIMNKIEADKAGVVTSICLNDGDVVEFGQNLIILS